MNIKRRGMDTDEMTVVDNSRSDGKRKHHPTLSIMLTVVQGSDADFGKSYNFTQHSIRIGRDRTNTIPVDDRKVSKHHCEISVIKTGELEQIIVKDLDSTNGTYINGESIGQWILQTGDKVSIGATVFRVNFNDEIEEEYHSRLFNFAATDALTGLYNRRYALNQLEKQRKIVKRNKRVFSIALIDVDDFKRINDTYGHQAGDEYLKQVAFLINHTLREQDIAGRVGGEEFLVVLPETDLEGAYQLANRIRERIHDAELVYEEHIIKATVSVGICQYKPERIEPGTVNNADYLFRLADNALYKAKTTGKNKVVKASPLE